jgi:uncharacterized membrane protein
MVEADELFRLIDRVDAVPGVACVQDQLDVHWPGEDEAPSEPLPLGRTPEIFQERWSPTTRLLMGGLGGTLVLGGALRHEALSTLIGLGLLGRAVTNLTLARLTGIGAGRRAIDVQKTIIVKAPVERVFDVWMRYGSFPFFMEHVLDVQREGEDRSRWVVAGPLGYAVSWEAVVTEAVPNERLTWETTAGSAMQHAGSVRFEPNGDGSTRVDIRLSYDPPGGALGHALAVLLGCDPKRLLDHDLVQLKSLIERGKTTAHHAEVTHEIPAAQTEPTLSTAPEIADVAG